MKIGIACGGTGGHIFPGLATAEVLRRCGHAVTLWLAGKDVEMSAVDGWNGPIVTVPAGGITSIFSFRNIGVAWRMMLAVRQCRRIMQDPKPDVLLAMGSYASVAPVWAAHTMRVPIVLHEANVVPGRAIRFLSRWAAAVAVGFEETRRHLQHRQVVLTGMPLRRGQESEVRGQVSGGTPSVQSTKGPPRLERGELACHAVRVAAKGGDVGGQQAVSSEQSAHRLVRHSHLGEGGSQVSAKMGEQWQQLQEGVFTVLVMGGSRGAHLLNERAVAAIIRLRQQGQSVQVIHLTGRADERAVRKQYEQAGVAHAVFGFLHDMTRAYQRASLAVCRSGASTCAELSGHGIPALLVPYPFATRQHQGANARAVADAGAADVRLESELSVEWLTDYLAARMADADGLERMKQAARRRQRGDAAEALADLVEQIGRGQ